MAVSMTTTMRTAKMFFSPHGPLLPKSKTAGATSSTEKKPAKNTARMISCGANRAAT